MRRENVRATDEIVTALNERRILLAFEPVVDAITRKPAFYECLMRIRRSDGTILAAGDIIPTAERLGLVRLIDYRVVELVVAELLALPDLKVSLNVSPASIIDPDWWGSFARTVRGTPASPSAWRSRSPKPPRSRTSRRQSALPPARRISDAASRSTTSAPATPRSAICACCGSTPSRSTART